MELEGSMRPRPGRPAGSRQPFLPLFFGDFLGATAEWTGEQRGLYLLALGHAWTAGSLPADLEKLRRLVGWERATFAAAWSQVAVKFVEADGRLTNDRLEAHRAKADQLAEIRSELGKRGAAKRWGGDSNGQGPPNGRGIAEPSVGDGNSQESAMASIPSDPTPSKTRSQSKKNPLPPFDPAAVPGLDLIAWADWVAYRAFAKPAIKPVSMPSAARAMAELGFSAAQRAAVANSIANGYQGLFAPKDAPNGRPILANRPTRYEQLTAALDRQIAQDQEAVALPGGPVRLSLVGDVRPGALPVVGEPVRTPR
jgi:uncharacterized protein YdaU (DUF1376 family)